MQCNYSRNMSPGFGRPPDGDPPPELDWDMFLGPAPLRRYNPNRAIYHFRWFWDYSGGQMTNLGRTRSTPSTGVSTCPGRSP